MPDFKTKVVSWKSLWIKRIDLNTYPLWLSMLNTFLPAPVSIQLLIKSRPSLNEIKDLHLLPDFYKEVLKMWLEIKNCVNIETDKDVLNECLWLNRLITIDKKCVIWKRWINRGIICVNDLLNDQNTFKTPEQFLSDHNLNNNFLKYCKLSRPYQVIGGKY